VKRALILAAAAFALVAVPSASIAQQAPKAALGIAMLTDQTNRKVKVADLRPGGTGHLMGIRAGDVITHAGGKRINSLAKMDAYVSKLKVGDPVELTVTRRGKIMQLKGTAMARAQ
jgi:S1-C subfamily serine protease